MADFTNPEPDFCQKKILRFCLKFGVRNEEILVTKSQPRTNLINKNTSLTETKPSGDLTGYKNIFK